VSFGLRVSTITGGQVVLVAEGVSVSFEEFVAARGPALWRSAWLLTGDDGLAEDLLQTALAKSWPAYERVSRNGGSFEAYVRRALVTTYASWWRRKWRGETPVSDPPDVPAGDGIGDIELRRDVVSALGRLPKRQRAVIVLRYFDDLTEAETARQMGCSVGAVKAHHSRAIRALRGSPLLRATQSEDMR
jgi:RNA polymerase sigma-70 factor (sigma-E family)